jgi:hypothetical protein
MLFGVLASLIAAVGCNASGDETVDTGESSAALHNWFEGLNPGTAETFTQDTPINLVFVGYDTGDIDEDALLSVLPASYTPVVRYSQFYGTPGHDVGLGFDFDYRVTYATPRFEHRFFKHLAQIGTPIPATIYQQAYNDQVTNVLDVDPEVLDIDGPAAEKWLASRAHSMLGIDTKRGYTVFFVNWHGRDDFRFHVYSKGDSPDPDTGHAFGDQDARKMIAWGGSHGRTWFVDLSAGPEAWTDNWAVDVADVDGDGLDDYRMPPIWEYVAGGNRDPSALSTDLGFLTRFVAIDLLFTPSPLYDPMVTAPGFRGKKVAHTEMFEDDPSENAAGFLDPDFVRARLAELEPYHGWEATLDDNDPIDADAQRALRIFAGLDSTTDCWTEYGDPFYQLGCYFQNNLARYIEPRDPADYVAEVFAFNTTDDNLGYQFGLLGFADDNQLDGTQTHVYEFGSPIYREFGYGFTATTVHELGHHFGLSHPHDGYDAEYGWDFGPGGDLHFAWLGNEAESVMHYLSTSNRFGQFNEDTIQRAHMAGYLNRANQLAADVLASEHPHALQAQWFIARANIRAAGARLAFADWKYEAAAREARRAYTDVLRAAVLVGVSENVANATGTPNLPTFRRHVCELRNVGL